MTSKAEAPNLEALDLAGDLEGVLLDARRLAAAAPGVHGRRRSGQGEAFWQYRDHRAEDGARLVDWRRSARGDRYFVREREREAAQTAWFWLDRDAGFAWRSDNTLPSKSRRALVLLLALGVVLTRTGERIGALGYPSRAGAHAMDRVAQDLTGPLHDAPPPPHSFVIFASDFYTPLETWRTRLQAAADSGARGVLLGISRSGRREFSVFRPHPLSGAGEASGNCDRQGRECARDAYQHRLAAQRDGIRDLGARFGFATLFHRNDHAPGLAFAQLIAAAERRARDIRLNIRAAVFCEPLGACGFDCVACALFHFARFAAAAAPHDVSTDTAARGAHHRRTNPGAGAALACCCCAR